MGWEINMAKKIGVQVGQQYVNVHASGGKAVEAASYLVRHFGPFD